MGCAMGIVKYLVFLFNLVFALAGAALIVIGVVVKIKATDALTDSNVAWAPIFVIVVGAIIFVIAFFGCCGAIRESTCMLTTYAIILLIFFIVQVAIGVFAFISIKDKTSFENEVYKDLDKLFRQDSAESREIFNGMQASLHCCGVKGPGDYHNDLPPSCCGEDGSSCTRGTAYPDGCVDKFTETITSYIRVIGIVVIVIAAVEIIGAIFALCLNSSIRNEYRRHAYA